MRVASADKEGAGRLWDGTSGHALATLPGSGPRWSPDGTRLATAGGKAGVAHRWDGSGWHQLARLEEHPGAGGAVAWSADGVRLTTSGAGMFVRWWEGVSDTELVLLLGGSPWWSLGGRRLALRALDGRAALGWDHRQATDCVEGP